MIIYCKCLDLSNMHSTQQIQLESGHVKAWIVIGSKTNLGEATPYAKQNSNNMLVQVKDTRYNTTVNLTTHFDI